MLPGQTCQRVAAKALLELIVALGIVGVLLTLVVGVLQRAHQAASRLEQASGRRQPNILIIITDDQGYHDVGFHGVKDFETPNLDSLARNGVECTQGYVTCSVCSPSRAGLLTGRYQTRFGHENLPPPGPNAGLPVKEITLADLLRNAGYRTAALGKWHLGSNSALFHPNVRGFRHFFGFMGGGHDYFNYGGSDPIQLNGQPVEGGDYLTHAITDQAVSFIDRRADDPFFLYVAYNCPHTPNQAPQEYLDRFAHIENPLRRVYAAKMTALDDGVGRILRRLRHHHLDHDTLVFYLSDNGGPLTAAALQNGADNTPLFGQKTQLYEGGIRVPFVVQWKRRLPRGTTYDHPVIALDIFSTALAVAGVKQPADRIIDGVNLMPYLSGENPEPPHEYLFWRQGGGRDFAARDLRYKIVRHNNGPVRLFDLQSKVGETKDISAEQPKELSRLLKVFQDWNSQMIPPLW